MTTTSEHDARMAEMTFASVYPHYVTKVEKKGRTKQELHAVITWLTGFDNDEIQEAITRELTFEAFFDLAKLNPKADQFQDPFVATTSKTSQPLSPSRFATWTSLLTSWPKAKPSKKCFGNR